VDEYERTVHRVHTEEVIPTEPVVPVVAAPTPVVPATPVVAATPAMQATPVVGARAAMTDRVVTDREYVRTRPTALEMARRIVGLAFGILQGLLVIRIVLLLLVANRENDIVQFVLGVTSPFVNPFRDMFALNQIGRSGSVLDVAAIVALIGWTLVEMLIIAILNLGSRRGTTAY
jgi:uncharacterized protein YggT (Ycf19 family)